MPLYDDPENEPGFARLAERHRWFPAVLEAEYGERETPEGEAVPPALDWMSDLSVEARYSFDEVECSLAYEDLKAGYACTIWDASGEDDRPWGVYVVDDFGPRLLPEYSVLDNEADDDALNDALQRAAEQLPDRLLAGEFTRTGEPAAVPEWLLAELPEQGDDDYLLEPIV